MVTSMGPTLLLLVENKYVLEFILYFYFILICLNVSVILNIRSLFSRYALANSLKLNNTYVIDCIHIELMYSLF